MSGARAPVAVSVVVPTFDSSAFVVETLESVLAQTRGDLELVLVDDGSRDDTVERVGRWLAAHPSLDATLLRAPHGGTAAARNAGIAVARGRFVLPLDADDRIAPTMVEACAAILEADPAVDLVYTDREDFGALAGVRRSGTFSLERLRWFNQIPYCSMYRRELWAAVGGYRPEVSGFDDWDLWIAAAVRGARAAHVREPLLQHRRHEGSQLGGLLPRFETLHARIMLRHAAAFDDDALEAARRVLDGGPPSAAMRAASFLFRARHAEGAPASREAR